MHGLLIATGLVALLPAAAAAQDTAAVMEPIHQFVDAFNKGDIKTATSLCADPTSIIDEFPPHEWHGAGACAKWARDYDADAKKNGVTDGVVTLGKPKHIDVTGSHAYVVIPADYAYKQRGKSTKETGSILTVALRKGAAGWRVTAWAWSKTSKT